MPRAKTRVAAVYNPNKIDTRRFHAAVADRARRHGWTDPLFLATTAEDPGTGMAREAVEAGAGLVLAAGGDGTVRNVAAGLAGSGVPLGIIPRGTGNLLARNLDLPIDDLDDQLRVAMSGRTRTIDLGRVTFSDPEGTEHDEVFLVMLGIGMDAELIAGADEDAKRRLGWVAYVGSFLRALFTGHRIRFVYAVDSGSFAFARARSLLVGNCGMLQGGMVLLPGAEIDDGFLDVLALRPKGGIGWAQTGYRVLVANKLLQLVPGTSRSRRGDSDAPGSSLRATAERFVGPETARTLDFGQGKRVEAHSLDGATKFQIDGDTIGDITMFRATVAHRSVGVRVSN